jgi:hypothetical protein
MLIGKPAGAFPEPLPGKRKSRRRKQMNLLDSELIDALAHHEAGHAVVCFLLYGEEVIKSVSVFTREGVKSETTTYSKLPIPMVCRPPVGAPRRGNPAPVSADAIVDAHGVMTYAGLAAEELMAGSDSPDAGDVEPEWLTPEQHHRCIADREALSKLASIVGATRDVEHFFADYWREARRLLRAHWAGVEGLANELRERGDLHGERVDMLLRASCGAL